MSRGIPVLEHLFAIESAWPKLPLATSALERRQGSGPFGKEVRHGDLADDLAGNDQIGGVSLSEDRGGRVAPPVGLELTSSWRPTRLTIQ